MAFWDEYKQSLKSKEVEEPIDLAIHRPLGYILAKVVRPTPITPNALTLFSVFVGFCAAVCLVVPFPYHAQVGGLLVTFSAVVDCSDGQLARMRKSSSNIGRMLDGTADMFVVGFVVSASAWQLWHSLHTPWHRYASLAAVLFTVVTSSWHTVAYDHYKNAWLKMTKPGFTDGEDVAQAEARYREEAPTAPLWLKAVWHVYLSYVRNQEKNVSMIDPKGVTSIGVLPDYSEESAAIYRKHCSGTMKALRYFFGVGTLMFGLAFCNAVEQVELILIFRGILLNGLFFFFVMPAQRRASQAALAEIAALEQAPLA